MYYIGQIYGEDFAKFVAFSEYMNFNTRAVISIFYVFPFLHPLPLASAYRDILLNVWQLALNNRMSFVPHPGFVENRSGGTTGLGGEGICTPKFW